jgi:hypothetical protein
MGLFYLFLPLFTDEYWRGVVQSSHHTPQSLWRPLQAPEAPQLALNRHSIDMGASFLYLPFPTWTNFCVE